MWWCKLRPGSSTDSAVNQHAHRVGNIQNNGKLNSAGKWFGCGVVGNLHQAAAAFGGDWEFIAGSTTARLLCGSVSLNSENTGALGDDTCRAYCVNGVQV